MEIYSTLASFIVKKVIIYCKLVINKTSRIPIHIIHDIKNIVVIFSYNSLPRSTSDIHIL